MILMDTHIWRWWVTGHPRLTPVHRAHIAAAGKDGLGLSVISCWEIAKAVETGNLTLSMPVAQWIHAALQIPDIVLLPLTPEIAIDSTELPQPLHKDPGDQMIIATARILNLPLLTDDGKILSYHAVVTLK